MQTNKQMNVENNSWLRIFEGCFDIIIYIYSAHTYEYLFAMSEVK